MSRLISYIFLLLLIPAMAYPHVYLLECSPEQDSVLKTSPEKVRITFVGNIEPFFSKIEVFDQNGKKASKKKMKFFEDNTIMEVELQDNLEPGKYTVKWKCMSLDGHKQTGEYTFTIA